MFTSSMFAPPRTWSTATLAASGNCPPSISRRNRADGRGRPRRHQRRRLAARSRAAGVADDRAGAVVPDHADGDRVRRLRLRRRGRPARRAPRRGARQGGGRTGCRGGGADARPGQGDRVREVREGRRDAAGGAGRGGQEVQGRRLPARHPGLQGPRTDGGLELRGQRQVLPRHRRLAPDGRHRGRHGRLHARERLEQGDGRHGAALDGLPLRRGQPRQALHGPRPRQVDALPLRRQAPGRLHVPLRDPAGAHAHGRRHGRDVRRQAEGPGAGRQGAVDDPAGVLPRQARQGAPTWPRCRPRSPT